MPLLRLPAAGGKAKAVSVDHKLAAGVAIALVFLILMAHTVYSGPQGCKLFCPDNNIHDPAPECNFSKPTDIFKSEYAPAFLGRFPFPPLTPPPPLPQRP